MKQSNIFFLIICTLLFFSPATAQQNSKTFTARILSAGTPVPVATIRIEKQVLHSDDNGLFTFSAIPGSTANIEISAIGLKTLKQKISIGNDNNTPLVFNLTNDDRQIEEIQVLGRTKVQDVNKQAYNVTALDATKLHNTTLDLGHALDRVSGVRVRESGGVGSDMNLTLNGYSGKQIKVFIDGIPMEGFGSSFQLNNIPINIAERVEVYRGVVPVWLGSDAMGGAINIVTGASKRNFVDLSYSYGSFNTHRTTLNAGYTTKSGFTMLLNAYQNYSDNNYRITVPEYGQRNEDVRVNRFHDTYHNEAIILQTGVVDKKYADRLLVGIQLGKTYKEMQTGARIQAVFGSWYRKGDIVMPTFKYSKRDLFVKGLNASINANINLGHEQNIDTVNVRYDWYGNPKYLSGVGSENNRTLYKFSNNTGIGTATFSYDINKRNAIVLNNVYTTFNRRGSDELFPENEAYERPRKSSKNVTGVDYRYNHDGKWSVTAFFKNYYQKLRYASSYNPTGNWGDVAYDNQKTNYNKVGYGAAGTYFLSSNLQFKGSYENAKRMPEADEIFGDQINRSSNLALKPETSYNYNLGASYTFSIQRDHQFAIDAGWLYRDSKDFIREKLDVNQVRTVMENRASVTNMGVDGEIRYSFKRLFTAGANLSYHNFRNNTKYETENSNVSPTYRDRLPNIPYLYGNADATVFLPNVGGKKNNLSIGYNLLYVDKIYLYWPSQGTTSSKLNTPTQLIHDVNVVYTMADGKYNIGVECKNLTNAEAYDNFSLPKPSRGFYLKLRYFLSNH